MFSFLQRIFARLGLKRSPLTMIATRLSGGSSKFAAKTVFFFALAYLIWGVFSLPLRLDETDTGFRPQIQRAQLDSEKPLPLYKQFEALSVASFALLFRVPVGNFSSHSSVEPESKPLPYVPTDTASISMGAATASVAVSPASEAPKIIKEPEEKLVNLETFGYRLTGIIKGNFDQSVAFVFDPKMQREVLVQSAPLKGSETIRLLGVSDRAVKIKTPQGIGLMRLEEGRLRSSKSGDFTNLSSGGDSTAGKSTYNPSAARTLSVARSDYKNAAPPPPEFSQDEAIQLLNSRTLQPRQEKDKWVVYVERVPPNSLFEAAGVQKGDKIVAVGNSGFMSTSQIPTRLGQLRNEKETLLVIRNGKPIQLKRPETKSNQNPQIDRNHPRIPAPLK